MLQQTQAQTSSNQTSGQTTTQSGGSAMRGMSYAAGSAALSMQGGAAGTVTVRPGDSLSLIARRTLGDSNRWQEIWEANKAQVPNPNAIMPGMILQLPGGAQTQAPPQTSTTTYTVRPGDSLSKISGVILGSPGRWREIWHLNRTQVPNPNFVSVGMVLRVPGQGPAPQQPEPSAPETDHEGPASANETQRIAMQITSIMETGSLGGYSALNDYDDGIISFGRHQATLAGGALEALLTRYLGSSNTPHAAALRPFMARVRQKDASLRSSSSFKDALRAAAADPAMQAAQDAAIIQSHYNPAAAAANGWNVTSPLGVAMLYDTKIQGGMETVLARAQNRVGGKPGQNGVTERAFLVAFNAERRARLIELAHARGLGTAHGKALMSSTYRCDAFDSLLATGNLALSGPIVVRGVSLDGVQQGPEQEPGPQDEEPTDFVALEKGATGAAVQTLQSRLVTLRYMSQSDMNTGPGIFGPKTEASVRRFQQAEGLSVTGKVNQATHDRLQTASPREPSAGFIHPTTSTHVTSPYGMRTHPISGVQKMHKGTDFAGSTGTPVYAVADGTVTVSGWDAGGYGNWLEIEHDNGTRTRYAHLSSKAVSQGAHVSQGQTIGAIGSTGGSTGPHLHFEVRIGGNAVDPSGYL